MIRLLPVLVFALAGCFEGPSWSVQVDEVACEDLDYGDPDFGAWAVPEGAVVQSVQVCGSDVCRPDDWRFQQSTAVVDDIDCAASTTVVVTYLLPAA